MSQMEQVGTNIKHSNQYIKKTMLLGKEGAAAARDIDSRGDMQAY